MLILCPRSDIAGVGIGIKRAFDRHSDIQVRHVARVRKFYDYPTDADWEQRDELIRWADLLHVMEIVGDYAKPTLYHHHGSYYRTHGGPPGICSTLDLHLAGAGEWVPNPVEVPDYRQPSDVLTIAHAPTNRVLKSTAAFEAAMDRLEQRVEVRRLIIEGVSHAECLRLKGMADIYFDQTGPAYGNNAVEAWMLGLPVIAGAQPDTLAEMERRFGQVPFYATTEDDLYYALLDLASSQVKRDYWGRIGRAHVERWHADQVVVPMLEDIYRGLGRL